MQVCILRHRFFVVVVVSNMWDLKAINRTINKSIHSSIAPNFVVLTVLYWRPGIGHCVPFYQASPYICMDCVSVRAHTITTTWERCAKVEWAGQNRQALSFKTFNFDLNEKMYIENLFMFSYSISCVVVSVIKRVSCSLLPHCCCWYDFSAFVNGLLRNHSDVLYWIDQKTWNVCLHSTKFDRYLEWGGRRAEESAKARRWVRAGKSERKRVRASKSKQERYTARKRQKELEGGWKSSKEAERDRDVRRVSKVRLKLYWHALWNWL